MPVGKNAAAESVKESAAANVGASARAGMRKRQKLTAQRKVMHEPVDKMRAQRSIGEGHGERRKEERLHGAEASNSNSARAEHATRGMPLRRPEGAHTGLTTGTGTGPNPCL
ncbi:hypothetical protein SDJN03_09326, partial [Cucurbita argyrosperma subsp. sororia]